MDWKPPCRTSKRYSSSRQSSDPEETRQVVPARRPEGAFQKSESLQGIGDSVVYLGMEHVDTTIIYIYIYVFIFVM